MGNKSLQELAELYCKDPAPGLRNAIISKSMPLIRSIIGKINTPDQPLTQREDLESAGISGLIQAMDSYECDRNIKFNTYVYYRIRGNIIDYLRKIDQLPRKKRKNYGKVKEAMQRLSQQLGREPSDEEVAGELDMDLEDYRKLLSNVQKRNALSLDKSFNKDDSNSFYEIHENKNAESPDQNLEKKELCNTLKQKIGELDERDRLILTLYYYEEMTMNEVAVLLELSEARISQIIGKLLIRLREELAHEELV
ncbi:FliA/WhiG family RNA polymerase sigma factor [Aliifodinibius sp. S!AR15-10]|uniref:FliA/WhiG family RNA polymerase sigma factor n=1 Tax=Aliifodinibius sp. S!AR15-10 TaxID=2950437 RepID=UPI002858DA1D|nr:FliA/WhiG family RNA polymerase sigma factor [Aliifodinibius sp. S!AR15-10]MDR8394239.1 FliA/WhiG family RNA polymerase sigma factor [Aliifodinibius sp. S!AR15-10]